MQIRSRIVSREFKSGDRPDLYAGTPPPESLNAIITIAVSPGPNFSRCMLTFFVHTSMPRLSLPADDSSAKDKGQSDFEEEHVRYQRCSKRLGTRLARAHGKLGYELGLFKKSVSQV